MLYKWFTNDISGLGAVFSLPLNDDKPMTDQGKFNGNCVISKKELGKSIVESSSVTGLKSSGLLAGEKMPSRTTPFWVSFSRLEYAHTIQKTFNPPLISVIYIFHSRSV